MLSLSSSPAAIDPSDALRSHSVVDHERARTPKTMRNFVSTSCCSKILDRGANLFTASTPHPRLVLETLLIVTESTTAAVTTTTMTCEYSIENSLKTSCHRILSRLDRSAQHPYLRPLYLDLKPSTNHPSQLTCAPFPASQEVRSSFQATDHSLVQAREIAAGF